MSSDQPESLLTVAEVAEWLKLNQQTIRNWIDAGSLPAVRVGRRVRIKRSDLDRIVAAGYQGAAAEPSGAEPAGPSAEDFWSGEPVGAADPDPDLEAASAAAEALAARRASDGEPGTAAGAAAGPDPGTATEPDADAPAPPDDEQEHDDP